MKKTEIQKKIISPELTDLPISYCKLPEEEFIILFLGCRVEDNIHKFRNEKHLIVSSFCFYHDISLYATVQKLVENRKRKTIVFLGPWNDEAVKGKVKMQEERIELLKYDNIWELIEDYYEEDSILKNSILLHYGEVVYTKGLIDSSNLLFLFKNVHWSNILLLFEIFDIKISGVSSTMTHRLSYTSYNLSNFIEQSLIFAETFDLTKKIEDDVNFKIYQDWGININDPLPESEKLWAKKIYEREKRIMNTKHLLISNSNNKSNSFNLEKHLDFSLKEKDLKFENQRDQIWNLEDIALIKLFKSTTDVKIQNYIIKLSLLKKLIFRDLINYCIITGNLPVTLSLEDFKKDLICKILPITEVIQRHSWPLSLKGILKKYDEICLEKNIFKLELLRKDIYKLSKNHNKTSKLINKYNKFNN